VLVAGFQISIAWYGKSERGHNTGKKRRILEGRQRHNYSTHSKVPFSTLSASKHRFVDQSKLSLDSTGDIEHIFSHFN
jgi:hypothetical protein